MTKDKVAHFQWNPDTQRWEVHKEDEGWGEKLTKIFAGLVYFGSLGISAGEAVASAGTDGLAVAEEIPLHAIDSSSIFNGSHTSDLTIETTIDPVIEETIVDVHPDTSIVFTGPEPMTSTPIRVNSGRPNINRQPAVYEGDLSLEPEVEVSTRGTGRNHEVVYVKNVPKASTRSGNFMRNLIYRPVSRIGTEIEMEPLIPEVTEVSDFNPLEGSSETLDLENPQWRPRDGTNWGRWRKGNWSYGFSRTGRGFHLRYKTQPVKWVKGKVHVFENGKWSPKEIPKTVVWTIKETQEQGVLDTSTPRRKRETPLRPGRHTITPIAPSPYVPIPIQPHKKTRGIHVHRKRRCIKRRGKRCVKYSL